MGKPAPSAKKAYRKPKLIKLSKAQSNEPGS